MSDYAYCPLCGNVNRADLGPVTGMCLDGRACRRRQAGVEPVNPDRGEDQILAEARWRQPIDANSRARLAKIRASEAGGGL